MTIKTATPQGPSINETLDELLAKLRKSAGTPEGDTSHPVGSADNGTSPASEGSFIGTTDKLLSEATPNSTTAGGGPDSAPSQESVQPQLGTTQAATGDDPASEKPATTEPMNSDNIDVPLKAASYSELLSLTQKLGSEVLAAIAEDANGDTTEIKQAAEDTAKRQAEFDRFVLEKTAETIKLANDRAELVVGFLAAMQKQAEDEESEEGESDSSSKSPSEEKDSAPPEDGGGPPVPPDAGNAGGGDPMGGGGEISPELLMQLLGQGDQMPVPPQMADPAAGGMGGDPMGGGMEGADPAMLAEALAQAGISPDQLKAGIARRKAASAKAKAKPNAQARKALVGKMAEYIRELVS